MDKAKFLIERYSKLKGIRTNYEIDLEAISEYVLQKPGNFFSQRSPGRSRAHNIFNTTASLAHENLASTLHGGLTNSSSKWCNLQFVNKTKVSQELKLYLENASNIILHTLNTNTYGFPSANYEIFKTITSLGTSCLFVEDTVNKGIRFMTIHMSQIYIALDRWNKVDTVINAFKLTARQAMQEESWKEKLSPAIISAEKNDPDAMFEFLHCVMPKEDYNSKTDFAYDSYYVEVDGARLLQQKGYHEMPYIVSRFDINQCETYGTSPAHKVLADVRMVNTIDKEGLTMLQFMAQPPILMADDNIVKRDVKIRPGLPIYGGIDSETGQDRLRPFNIGGQINSMIISIQRAEERIKKAFFEDFLSQANGPAITATEAVQRRDERLRMLSPHIERLQQEYLNPVIDRVFGILLRQGALGPVPDELKGVDLRIGDHYIIEYSSPLSRLALLEEAQSILRFGGIVGPLAQVYPTVFDTLNAERLGPYAADSSGVPESLKNTEKELSDLRASRQQQQQMQQNLQLAQASKDLATPIPTQAQ